MRIPNFGHSSNSSILIAVVGLKLIAQPRFFARNLLSPSTNESWIKNIQRMPSEYQRIGFTILSLIFFSAVAATSTAPTAYELLQSYDFPVGILPKGITHYDLDASSGRFDAYLNGSCSFSLEGSYQLKYNPRISGNIYKDTLTNLSGVSVKVLFFWLNIVEVRRNGENLEFSVGVASAEFPIDNFYVCPQCGCGLNCKPLEEKWKTGNIRGNSLVFEI